MTALTVRPRTHADRATVDHLKATNGGAAASRAILRAVREYPCLVHQRKEERRTAETRLRHALEQARAALPND